MKKKEKDKIVNSIITEMYSSTNLTANFIGGFVGLLNRLDDGIGYSPYTKTRIIESYIDGAKNQCLESITCEQHERFKERMRGVYLE